MILIFFYSCEHSERLEMQKKLTDILGLCHTNSKITLNTIASFAGNINSEEAYREFCRDLSQMGVTMDMINRKKKQILDILGPQHTASSTSVNNQADMLQISTDSTTTEHAIGPTNPNPNSTRSGGPLMLVASEAISPIQLATVSFSPRGLASLLLAPKPPPRGLPYANDASPCQFFFLFFFLFRFGPA